MAAARSASLTLPPAEMPCDIQGRGQLDRRRLTALAGSSWGAVLGLTIVVLVGWGAVSLRATVEARITTSAPLVPSVDVYRLFVDDTPVLVTVTAGWEKVTEWTTRDLLGRDATLWGRMHVDDWDRVPDGVRERALEAMLGRFRHVLASPSEWDRMDAHDWDEVPQPVRMLAYRHMTEYWTGYYDLGGAHGIPRGLMADTVAAIVLSESWCEHRAEHVNQWGNRDLGVAQASDRARVRIHELYAQGLSDFDLADEEYFNPWNGTRFAAFWVALLLDEVDGELGTAVRAYHRGTRRALAGLGLEYQQTVEARRRTYVRNGGRSRAWSYLWTRDRQIRAEEWPWMASVGRAVALMESDPMLAVVASSLGLAR